MEITRCPTAWDCNEAHEAIKRLRERNAALVALCEEVIDDLCLHDERAFKQGYRERLAKMKEPAR